MSGVYIKGMGMPTSPVLFCIHPDGKVFADLEGGWREYKAILVPEHGRLIDADALEEEAQRLYSSGYISYEAMLVIDAALHCNATTIIPKDCDGCKYREENREEE